MLGPQQLCTREAFPVCTLIWINIGSCTPLDLAPVPWLHLPCPGGLPDLGDFSTSADTQDTPSLGPYAEHRAAFGLLPPKQNPGQHQVCEHWVGMARHPLQTSHITSRSPGEKQSQRK